MPFSTFRGLARVAEVRAAQLSAVLAHVDRNYRLVKIPKRTPGEFRNISIPKPTLMHIQRVICHHALKHAQGTDYAHAYVSDKSTVSHAKTHLGSRAFIQIDISNFFPSISRDRVAETFRKLGYDPSLTEQLATLCTFEGSLPQGAPTSPALSNLAVSELDQSLAQFSALHGLKYSRYADDIVISGKKIDINNFEAAKLIVEMCGFSVNFSKTRLMNDPSKVILTGISISEGKMKVPKKFKRQLRKEAFEIAMVSSMLKPSEKFDPFHLDRVMGRLLYWKRIEPEAQFPKKYIEILKLRYSLKGRA